MLCQELLVHVWMSCMYELYVYDMDDMSHRADPTDGVGTTNLPQGFIQGIQLLLFAAVGFGKCCCVLCFIPTDF